MPAMPHACHHVGGGIKYMGNGDGYNLLVASEDVGAVTVLRSGGCGGVVSGVPSE